MPELPEVEIVARRATAALRGREIASVLVPGVNALRSVDPPPDVLAGATVTGVRRRGKLLLLDTDGDHLLLIHLMTGGALRWSGEAKLRDRALRLVVRFADDADALRLRERGTRQQAWLRAVRRTDLEAGEVPELAHLGPEAWWPEGDEPASGVVGERFRGDGVEDGETAESGPTAEARIAAVSAAMTGARPLHALLRDQRVLAGIGRTWSDEILWAAQRSPYQRASDLDDDARAELLRTARDVLGGALAHYEEKVGDEPAEKPKKPVQVHGRVGETCPRCGATLRGVHFESYTIAYCPKEQTGGRVLKDRRLSRLGIDAPDED